MDHSFELAARSRDAILEGTRRVRLPPGRDGEVRNHVDRFDDGAERRSEAACRVRGVDRFLGHV